MTSLAIDFERFLLLTAAIAAVDCRGAPARSATPAAPATIAAVAPTSDPSSGAQPEGEVASGPIDDTVAPPPPEDPIDAGPPKPHLDCDNDEGNVSCDFIDPRRFAGPACEGFSGTCDLLKSGYGYRPRVAAAAARCFAKKGVAACNISVRNKCLRTAIGEACPDPSFGSFCDDALARCKDKKLRPDFGRDECIKALSSLSGGELEWAKSAIGPSAEGCKLMYPVY